MHQDETLPLQQLLNQFLIDVGFEPLEDGNPHYRAFVQSPVSPGEQHLVFVSLDDSMPAIMSPFGNASEISTTELDLVRVPGDQYEVITVASQAALNQPFTREEMLQNPEQIVTSAVQIANFAAMVEDGIAKIKQEKTEILDRLQRLINPDNWNLVASGDVLPDAFIADAERVLTIIPVEGLWRSLMSAASRAAIWTWANGSDTHQMSTSPWNRIADSLQSYGNLRAWKLD